MKIGSEDKKKLTIAIVLGCLALTGLYSMWDELYGGPSTPAPVAVSAAAAKPGPSLRPQADSDAADAPATKAVAAAKKPAGPASLDPTLHMEAMLVTESVVYAGNGRNIFSATSAPEVVIPKPVAVARVAPPPVPIAPPRPMGPPPPEPIPLKFFGTVTSADKAGAEKTRATLLHDDETYIVSVGDIVLRRYKVLSIAANSIEMEDMQSPNKQTLPRVAN